MISSLPLDNFYPVFDIVPTSSEENESDESSHTVRSLVMVRATSCQCRDLEFFVLPFSYAGQLRRLRPRTCCRKSSNRM